MKPIFLTSMGRLPRKLRSLAVWAGVVLAPLSGRGTDLFYTNYGTVIGFPPNIDAINFVNFGTFNIFTLLPFDTSSTLNFTNGGTMLGAVGYRFDTSPVESGPRRLAANFVNQTWDGTYRGPGTIEAWDSSLGGSKLFVAATNIINRGLLTIGAGGELQLVGTNVDLYRGGIQVAPIVPGGSSGVGTNYSPDVAIYDNYWAQANQTMDSSRLLSVRFGTNLIVRWPSHQVSGPGGAFGFVPEPNPGFVNPISNFTSEVVSGTFVILTNNDNGGNPPPSNWTPGTNDFYTVFVPTNIVRQAAFVSILDSNVTARIRWSPSSSPTNEFKAAAVELVVGSTNLVTAFPETTTIYFVDKLASEANRGLTLNVNSLPYPTFRPAPYSISRAMPVEFSFGQDGNDVMTNTFFYATNFSTPNANATYAAYSAFVDNVVSRPTLQYGGTVTNLPGRINIYADSLNLDRVRMRAEGLVTIQAQHLVGSSNAVVDSENLSYDLGSTNGLLKIQNLARESVARLRGDIDVWSGLWTNVMTTVLTNNYRPVTTNSPGGPVTTWFLSPITFNVRVGLHALILDARYLLTQLPVTVYDFIAHSTNTVVNDSMTVADRFLIDGQGFTIEGRITLSANLQDWIYTNAPNLKYFTNNGTFTIPNSAHFGDDGPTQYLAFVNRGTIDAAGQAIKSDYYELSGTHRTGAGAVTVITRSGKVEGGRIDSNSDIHFFADVLKFARSTNSARTRLDLTVTNWLYDEGGNSFNLWSCRDGFRLTRKPNSGDLLGTTIQTRAPSFAEVDHLWAGVNRGATVDGYSHNTALGKLVLTPEGSDPLFFFSGTGVTETNNGLYVDVLDLSQLSDYQSQLLIDPSLVIYFAAANLGFTPPSTNGAPQQPEEYLDGQFGGHLRWVRDFAGPNSSVDVVIYGQTAKRNRALRYSRIIDSDVDGIPNYYDLNPFDTRPNPTAALVQTNQPPSKALSISWEAAPQAVYQVEFTTNLPPANWQALLKYTNNTPAFRTVTILDTNAPSAGSRRFYRVGYSP